MVPDWTLNGSVSGSRSSGFTAINRHEQPREPRQMLRIKKHNDFSQKPPQRRLVLLSFVLFSDSASYCVVLKRSFRQC